MSYKKISVAELRRLRAAGLTLDQIAEKLGCSRGTVWGWCKRHDIPAANGPGRKPRASWHQAEQLYRVLYWDLGLTLEEIAQRSGTTASTMQKRFVVLGIGRRPRGGPGRSPRGSSS